MQHYVIGVDEVGEKAWDAFARPCHIFLEVTKRSMDKVYSFCKQVCFLRSLKIVSKLPFYSYHLKVRKRSTFFE